MFYQKSKCFSKKFIGRILITGGEEMCPPGMFILEYTFRGKSLSWYILSGGDKNMGGTFVTPHRPKPNHYEKPREDCSSSCKIFWGYSTFSSPPPPFLCLIMIENFTLIKNRIKTCLKIKVKCSNL